MQRLRNLFKIDNSPSDNSLPENELVQQQRENEFLTRVLDSERAKNRDLERKVEKKKIELVHQISIEKEKEIENKTVFEPIIQEQAGKIEKLRKENGVFQEFIQTWIPGSNLDPKFAKEFLKKEKEEKEKLRADILKYREAIQKTQEEAEGDSKAWNRCEVCAYEYEDKTEKVPRVLECGHTICESCVLQLANQLSGLVQCPFDRLYTTMGGKVENLPKNLALLHQ